MSSHDIHAEIAAVYDEFEDAAYEEKMQTRLLRAKEQVEIIEYQWNKALREASDANREFGFAIAHRDRLKTESRDWEKHCTARFKNQVHREVKDASKRCKDAEADTRTLEKDLEEAKAEERFCRRSLQLLARVTAPRPPR